MLLHPLVQTLIIWSHPEQLLPEVPAMILHPGMNQFVQNDVIPEFVGQKCQKSDPIQIYPAFLTTFLLQASISAPQAFDGPESLHQETVEMIFDSISSLLPLSFTSNMQNEKLF
jgi:hypothetical protein